MVVMGALERPQPPDEHDDAVLDTTPDEHEPAGSDVARWERAGDLFERWLDGETRAIDELVRLMSPVLWHIVRAYGLDRAMAEDVVQTTWLTLVRRHESIADPRAVSGWLTVSARREAWRVSRVHRRADPTEAVDLEPHLPTAPSAEHTATLSDEARHLWGAVAQLTERCQRLLRVIAFDDRPDYARIADELKMPVGSIGPTRQRCLGKLRVLLEGEGRSA